MTGPASAERILVVDDDADFVAMMAGWLADLGTVYTATTSAQAIALARAVHPSIALLDVMMPRMDGFTLASALRLDAGLRDMQIVIVTGSDRLDVGFRALDVSAAAVLFKPVDEEVLRETVKTLIGPANSV